MFQKESHPVKIKINYIILQQEYLSTGNVIVQKKKRGNVTGNGVTQKKRQKDSRKREEKKNTT